MATDSSPRGRTVLRRSVLAGITLGAVSAITYTIDGAARQPNFAPPSIALAFAWLFPLLLVAGLILGVIVGLVSGTVAIIFRRVSIRRILFVTTFVILSAAAVLVALPEEDWGAGLIPRLVILVVGCLVAVFTATRLFR